MTKTANRRRKVIMPVSIKKKLGAAICMLLIAAIMMISSTYAWFTLSTAPEVKGIQTNVGANGNLEIALLSGTALFSDQDDLGILSAIGDSMDVAGKDVTVANATWGNLVDLSTAYGLNTVTMLPSALNISEILDDSNQSTGEYTINSDSPLLAPLYGSDGRVISVKTETLIGKYQDPSIYPLVNRTSGNGVGVIGTASGRNERMKNYPVALGNALNYINAARNNAQSTLQTYGPNLSSILVNASADDDATFTRDQVATLNSLITGIETANNYVWLAIKNIALASTLSRANNVGLTDAQVTQLVADVEAATTPAELAAVTNMRTLTNEINAAIANYQAAAERIANAKAAYAALDVENHESFAYDIPNSNNDIKYVLTLIINKEYAKIAGIQNPNSTHTEELAQAAMSGAIPIELMSGSGMLYDIAKSAGTYSVTLYSVPVLAKGITVYPNINITASVADTNEDPVLLTAARDQAVADLAPTNASGSTGSLDNAYGYAIDFGFRTNAPDAKLLLQDQARQRIYNDGTVTNTQTLGGGTYVKFSSLDLDKFTLDDIRALVSALRIVFAIPELGEDSETGNVTLSYKILTIAAPDITVTVNETTGEKTYAGGTTSDEDNDGTAETLTVSIALFGFTVADASDGGKIVTLGTKKLDAEDNTKNDLTLLTLTQNVAQKLSTVIYFDGDAIDNTMVANAEKSMTGSLNFQFATDVDLVPMENASLRNGENAPSEAEQIAAAKTKLHTAIEYIEGCGTYDTISAKAEEDLTEDEAAFLTSLNNANTVYANGNATLDEVNSAGTDLASKFNAVATNEEKAELLQLMQ